MSKKGFSLIELVIAIALIGVMATVVVPRFSRQNFRAERDKFVTKLNTTLLLGYQNALSTGKLHRLLIDFDKKFMKLEIENSGNSTQIKAESSYKSLDIPYVRSEIKFEDYEIINLYINKSDKLTGRGQTKQSWFFISPSGLAQEVTLNLQYLKNPDNLNTNFALVLNPFTVQFKTYDEFQKP